MGVQNIHISQLLVKASTIKQLSGEKLADKLLKIQMALKNPNNELPKLRVCKANTGSMVVTDGYCTLTAYWICRNTLYYIR